MTTIEQDQQLVAYCGLYCGACRAYLKGRCAGCREANRGWCAVTKCCREHHYATCADCREFADPHECARFNNVMSKLMAVVFNSDRRACVLKLRELGPERFASFMAKCGRQTIPRR